MQVPVASVEVSPTAVVLSSGQSLQLTVTLKDKDGNVVTGRPISWASSEPGAVSVDATGTITAGAAGSASVSVTSEGITGSINATSEPLSVLIDASSGGGGWWFPQYPGSYDSALPHQGKAFADYLSSAPHLGRAVGVAIDVAEQYQPFIATLDDLRSNDLVVSAGVNLRAGTGVLDAYTEYVSEGGQLLLLADFNRFGSDALAAAFGVTCAGVTTGPNLMHFRPHSVTSGMPSHVYRYIVGCGLLALPDGSEILANLDDDSFLDLNDNRALDPGEPVAPAVMATFQFGEGRVILLGDVNMLQSVPQPLVDNILSALLW